MKGQPYLIDHPKGAACKLLNLRRVVKLKAANRFFVAELVIARLSSTVSTTKYISPEIAKDKYYSNVVDCWAYSVFIYEMIYGHALFATQSHKTTISNIINMP
ncbi:hypothetical protein F8388_010597 [Cannabis sativa]|uniref:non-specific serine/threonine protein kinase n=1 Tax=Cannabis sativa TaxID=3483 RepID=A0A7J6GSF7_CANSA|nr:hypothetical protein F8388_010597 [Cannabis sativa]